MTRTSQFAHYRHDFTLLNAEVYGNMRVHEPLDSTFSLSACRMLLLSVARPSLEYRIEIWDCNKSQAKALESVILGGARKIFGCSPRTCKEAVRGDLGLEL